MDFLCINPQFLKFIKGPCLFFKYMDNDITIIHKYPEAVLQPLYPARFHAGMLKLIFDLFFDCFYLCGAFPCTDDKIICYLGQTMQIEDYEVFGLFAECGLCRCKSLVSTF